MRKGMKLLAVDCNLSFLKREVDFREINKRKPADKRENSAFSIQLSMLIQSKLVFCLIQFAIQPSELNIKNSLQRKNVHSTFE
jgi:hypothetical protein